MILLTILLTVLWPKAIHSLVVSIVMLIQFGLWTATLYVTNTWQLVPVQFLGIRKQPKLLPQLSA